MKRFTTDLIKHDDKREYVALTASPDGVEGFVSLKGMELSGSATWDMIRSIIAKVMYPPPKLLKGATDHER